MKVFFALSLALFLAGCFFAPAPAPVRETPSIGEIIQLAPAFDALVPKDANIEKVTTGFWFSDVPGNVLRSVTPSGEVKVLIQNAGGIASAHPDRSSGPTA